MSNPSGRHGTSTRYTRGCRCVPCRAAGSDYRRRRKIVPLADDDPRHGTNYGYVHFRCRCPACRAAHTLEQLAYRNARRDAARRVAGAKTVRTLTVSSEGECSCCDKPIAAGSRVVLVDGETYLHERHVKRAA